MLTLKKYANGRFYDIENKQYVTKDQLSELIQENEKIRVVLAKTGRDVTKSVVSSLPASKKEKTNGKNKLVLKKKALKKRVKDHKKWIAKQIDKRMDTILEMMSVPNKQQVTKLNADVRKLAKKIDNLQNCHAKARKKMKLEHQKELELLVQQYEKPTVPEKTEAVAQAA